MKINLKINFGGKKIMGALRVPMSKTSQVSYEEGIYKAKIVKVEKVEGKFGAQIKWTFKILSGKYKGKTLFTWTPFLITPKNRTGKWLKKIKPNIKFKDTKFSLSEVVMNAIVKISIVHTEKVLDDGSPQSKIDNLFSLKGKAKSDDDDEEDNDDDGDEDNDSDDDIDEDEDNEDDDDNEDEDNDDEDEDDDEEEEKPRKKNKSKSKMKNKKKSRKDDDDDDDDDEDDMAW